ncbi:MAG: hypothetical protein EBS07_06410 [Sphingobacteriia bacterium]|nr:hypothetical protein [Sphingobacteriia bacterium]
MDFNGLLKEIQKNKFAPVYFLIGEEPYFIDKITLKLESSVVEESLRGFNQDIIYGNEATGAKLSGLLRSYPVMAPQRLVILKEAQKMKKDELEIKNSDNTMANCFDVILENEDYTIGKVVLN